LSRQPGVPSPLQGAHLPRPRQGALWPAAAALWRGRRRGWAVRVRPEPRRGAAADAPGGAPALCARLGAGSRGHIREEGSMTSHTAAQTEKTLLHHLQAFQAGDVDAMMADYPADAMLMTPHGVLKGHEQIRALFTQIFTDMFPPDSTSLEILQ